MADIFDKNQRSLHMKKISSRGNKSTEMKLIQIFRANNITGWRRGYPVIGHPDFVFLKQKVAVFVDGCFWHVHNCRSFKPKSNIDYWSKKQESNVRRDKIVTELFEKRGWKVIRVWECELKRNELPDKLSFLKN